MKTLLIALCILLLLIMCFVYSSVCMNRISDTLVKLEKDIENNINNYKKPYNKLKKYWNKNEKLLMAICNHKICDDIAISIERLESYLKYTDESSAQKYSELYALKKLSRDITKTEKLTLFNVF